MTGGEAEAAYRSIRASRTDVRRIARNTGMKAGNIQIIKDHLFTSPHWLDKYESYGIPGEYRLFDSDLRIAEAWARLEAGTFGHDDVKLLRHEMAEAWYMRQHGPSYRAAHDAAQRRFPSPY